MTDERNERAKAQLEVLRSLIKRVEAIPDEAKHLDFPDIRAKDMELRARDEELDVTNISDESMDAHIALTEQKIILWEDYLLRVSKYMEKANG